MCDYTKYIANIAGKSSIIHLHCKATQNIEIIPGKGLQEHYIEFQFLQYECQ